MIEINSLFRSRYSVNTLKAYDVDLKKFFKFHEKIESELIAFSLDNLEKYNEDLFQQGLSSNTHRRRVSSLSSYADFLTEEGVIEFNFCSRLKIPAQDTKPKARVISDDIVERLFELITVLAPEA